MIFIEVGPFSEVFDDIFLSYLRMSKTLSTPIKPMVQIESTSETPTSEQSSSKYGSARTLRR